MEWSLQEAKNRFSYLVNLAQKEGPQIVTKRGQKTAVLLSYEDYQKMIQPQQDLVSFFQHSPLKDMVIEERQKDQPRPIDL